MSYGFQALNDNNQVLISSETKNLHFIQKLTGPRNTTVSISDPDAGIIYSTNINGGIRRWRYTATCANTPVPFFTMPTNDFYGILRIVNKNNSRWDIEIFRSGTSDTVPELYIFSDPALPFTLPHRGSSAYETAFTAAQQSSGRLVPIRAYPDSEYVIYKYTVSGGGFFASYLESARQGSIVPLQDFTTMTALSPTGQTATSDVSYTVLLPWNISFGTRDNIDRLYISKCSVVTFDTPRLDIPNVHVPYSGWSTPNLDDCILLSSADRWSFDDTAYSNQFNPAGVWVTTTGTAPNRRFYIRARFHDITGGALTAALNLPPPLSWQIMLPENDPGKQWIRFGQNSDYTWPENFPKAYIYKDTTEYGMVVYRDDGSPSFDSRKQPLVVNAAVTVTHPSNPRTVSAISSEATAARSCNAVNADNAYMFQADQTNSYIMYPSSLSTNPAKPIFSFLSIAQSQRQITAYNTQGYNDQFWGQETNRDYFYSYYWQFYRGAISNPVTTLTGLHILSEDITRTLGTQPNSEFNITNNFFFNKSSTGAWEQRATPSGDDGLWVQYLPWDIYFTNKEGTAAVAYNAVFISTNGYLTFNYFNYSSNTYRDPDAGSFEYSNLITASTLVGARIMIYGADNSAYRYYADITGTAPNRVYRIRYTGYPSSNGWTQYATATPTLVWEIQFPENKPDEMYIVFPAIIQVQGGAVLGVGTSNGWQTVSQPSVFSEQITPKNLIIKKVRSAADYRDSPVLRAGWGTHDFGCNYYFYNSGGGGAIGGLFGPGSNTSTGGVWPYTNDTLNLADNTVIVADGSKYD